MPNPAPVGASLKKVSRHPRPLLLQVPQGDLPLIIHILVRNNISGSVRNVGYDQSDTEPDVNAHHDIRREPEIGTKDRAGDDLRGGYLQIPIARRALIVSAALVCVTHLPPFATHKC
jgi:hypothetical protein